LALISCGADNQQQPANGAAAATGGEPANELAVVEKSATPKITFVELGSVNCIPCKAMQPVMQAIEQKYGEQIRVVFYDVWTPEEQKYAQQFDIRLIPTQVFLDENGTEIFRHEGFFAEAEIDQLLQSRGLKILPQS
jgi:thioredoxin 1